MQRLWFFLGALLMASGIGLGAYGAHGLRIVVTLPRQIEAFEYAVQYQLIQGLSLFVCSWAMTQFRAGLVNLAATLFLLGTLCFSLSIYLLILCNWRPWPFITPTGGFLLIMGWLVLGLAAFFKEPSYKRW